MRFAEETYVLEFLPWEFLRPVGADVPEPCVSWAAAVPGRLRAVDAESTGPGDGIVVGGIDGARRSQHNAFVSATVRRDSLAKNNKQ